MSIRIFTAIFFLGFSPVAAQETVSQPPQRVIPAAPRPEKYWDALMFKDERGQDRKFGYCQTELNYFQQDGKTLTRAKQQFLMAMKQGNARIELKSELTTEEDGELLLKLQYKDPTMLKTMVLQPQGGYLVTTTRDGRAVEDRIHKRFKPLGIAAELRLITAQRKVGDTFEYQTFLPSLNYIVSVKGEAKALDHLARNGKVEEAESLRIETKAEKIGKYPTPQGTHWIDPKTGALKGSKSDIPGIGVIALVRTTEAYAKSRDDILPDTEQNNIPLSEKLTGLDRRSEATFRFTLELPGEPEELFDKHDLHTFRSLGSREFELKVSSRRAPSALTNAAPAPQEYLTANAVIASDDGRVIALARQAAGSARTPWTQAQAMERWAQANFRVADGLPLRTAKDIANDPSGLRGNCRHYAILLTAMCRAQGIPSRTAIGLIYAEPKGKPLFAFHMWTEVYINGEWLGLDATLGEGAIGPGHIKITDSSWAGETDMKPFLPVSAFISKHPKIEFVK